MRPDATPISFEDLECLQFALIELRHADRQALLTKTERRTYQPGEAIIEQGQMHDALQIITKGAARVVRGPAMRGDNDYAGPLGRSDTIGEISYIDGFGAIATLIAENEVEVLSISFADIDALTENDDAFKARIYRALLAAMVARLRNAHRQELLPFA